MADQQQPRIGDRVVRRPRVSEVMPSVIHDPPVRHPPRFLTAPYILFGGFTALILLGGLLLWLPVSSTHEGATPFVTAMFTSTSAVTVTGHIVEPTSSYWTSFGQGVIFVLMLVGGLGFMTVATFLLIITGRRLGLAERILMREAMGVDRMGNLVRVTRNIILMVMGLYALGIILLWWRLLGFFDAGEAMWQAAFLSVSSFNNAGFSILPDEAGILAGSFIRNLPLLGFMATLIILGSIGWTTLVDVSRRHRFSRLSLDTKMVLTTSLFLYVLGAAVILFTEFGNENTLGAFPIAERVYQAIFHSISGRTAGFSTIDFGQASEFTLLFYPFLMFVGGAAGSVAGGIKVATFAVIIAAVFSSLRGRQQVEAFGREIDPFQVHRAVTVAVLGITVAFFAMLILTLTEDIPFRQLLFDTVSAFGTTGLSTGASADLTVAGEGIFMVLMLLGRLGPLTMALALVPRGEASLYRYVQERVKIG